MNRLCGLPGSTYQAPPMPAPTGATLCQLAILTRTPLGGRQCRGIPEFLHLSGGRILGVPHGLPRGQRRAAQHVHSGHRRTRGITSSSGQEFAFPKMFCCGSPAEMLASRSGRISIAPVRMACSLMSTPLDTVVLLARLIRMLHEDERGCRRLLHLACEYLAMPRLRPARCDELLNPLLGLTSLRFWNLAGSALRARMQRIQPVVSRHPHRVPANSLVLAAYGNGLVEDLHAGICSGYSLNHRRATNRQIQEVMRFTSERLAAVLASFRPWERGAGSVFAWPKNLAGVYISPRLTSRTWSLTETCSRIDLKSAPGLLCGTQ